MDGARRGAPPVFVSVPAAITSNSTVAFTGSGGTALQCSIDGAYEDCTSPFTPILADGAHTIAVRQPTTTAAPRSDRNDLHARHDRNRAGLEGGSVAWTPPP